MKENKRIAEFMDWKQCDPNDNTIYANPTNGALHSSDSDMRFHTSWDWLMPVIEKIDSYACEEMDFSDYDDYRNKYVFIHNISLHNDIREVYNQIVEFINEHNNN